jgi:DNA-binding beta-propeller fold protein YncE
MFPEGPVLFGGDLTGGNIVVWNLETGSQRAYPGFDNWAFRLGPSYRGDHVVVMHDTTGMLGEWELWPNLQLLDTVRLASNLPWIAAAVGPNAYLLAYHNETIAQFPGVTRSFGLISPSHIVLSDSQQRAIVAGHWSDGIPVFDTGIGDTAFTVPLQLLNGAVFSHDGTRLYLVGSDQVLDGLTRLILVNAGSGAPLGEDTLPATNEGYAVALAPSEGFLFVLAKMDSLPQVLVFDSETLTLVGTLIVPHPWSAPCTFSTSICSQGVISIDESTRTLYLAIPGNTATVIHRFDLLQ